MNIDTGLLDGVNDVNRVRFAHGYGVQLQVGKLALPTFRSRVKIDLEKLLAQKSLFSLQIIAATAGMCNSWFPTKLRIQR